MTLCLWAMFIWGSLAALVVGLGKSLCLRRCEVGMQLLSRYVMLFILWESLVLRDPPERVFALLMTCIASR